MAENGSPNGTTHSLDIEEEGLRPKRDRQWPKVNLLITRKQPSTSQSST